MGKSKAVTHSLWVFPESGDSMVCTDGQDGGKVVPFKLFPAFDLEHEDGSTHWCVRQRLLGGDSEPVAEIWNGAGMSILTGLMVDGHKLTQAEADGMQHEMCAYLASLWSLAPEMQKLLSDMANQSSLRSEAQQVADNERFSDRAARLLGKLYDRAKSK